MAGKIKSVWARKRKDRSGLAGGCAAMLESRTSSLFALPVQTLWDRGKDSSPIGSPAQALTFRTLM